MNHDLILNRYRPIALGGEGGSGTVEICWDTRIQRRVAIKRLPVARREQPGPIPGLAEARTGAMLSHPNIVNVIDFEATNEEAFLIMEAIEGPALTDLIEDAPDHMLSLDVAAAVVRAVGDALVFAHENQVLHLDVKPDNILVTRNGQVKVSDFGVSELAGVHGFGSAVGGTIGYMPPEQMLGYDLDERCDEFAFAAVVYEMLTGECPFYADSLDESLGRIDRFDVVAPSALRGDVDPALDDVLLAALDPDLRVRYGSVLDFLDELEPLLGDVRAGTRELEELANLDDEQEPEGADEPRAGFFAAHPRALAGLGRAACFALCWWVAGNGLVHSGLLDTPLAFGAALFVGALAAAFPAIGTSVALAVLGAAIAYVAGASMAASAPVAAASGDVVAGACWVASALLLAVLVGGSGRGTAARAAGAVLAVAMLAAGQAASYVLTAGVSWTCALAAVSACAVVAAALNNPRS